MVEVSLTVAPAASVVTIVVGILEEDRDVSHMNMLTQHKDEKYTVGTVMKEVKVLKMVLTPSFTLLW